MDLEEVETGAPRVRSRSGSLRITEIFRSLQGESASAGWPTVFVRLTGCPLRCVYCDSAYAFKGGQWMGVDEIVATVAGYRTRRVCVTGGEPLAQPECRSLLVRLADAGYRVSLETSGALAIDAVDPRVRIVMDLKTPASGEMARNHWENLQHLKPDDEIKFVIGGRADFDWAMERVIQHTLDRRFQVLFSPVFDLVEPRELAEWLLATGRELRMQLQMHKQLWGEEPGR
ncbi:MAG: 7-carboxy-7-deazaguanine synthase QueE [Halothiobacillaceae bacterium]